METATLSYGFFHLPSEEQGEPFHAIKETENYIRDRKTRGEKCYREKGSGWSGMKNSEKKYIWSIEW